MLKAAKEKEFGQNCGCAQPHTLECAVTKVVNIATLGHQQLKTQPLINRLWETKVLCIACNPQMFILVRERVSFVFSS